MRGGDVNLYGYVGNDPVNFIDPIGLFVFGLGYGGSIGAIGAVDVAAGGVKDLEGNTAAFSSASATAGTQFTASYGPTVLLSLAKSVHDIQGATLDIQLRLLGQVTISIPADLNLRNTVIAIDFTPGLNLGLGIGGGGTKVFGIDGFQKSLECE